VVTGEQLAAGELDGELHLTPDAAPDFDAIPGAPGVFVLEFASGPPHLARTATLRRRLQRLLGASSPRFAAVREAARCVRYRVTGSPFETSLRLYGLARLLFPETYRKHLRLRPPAFVKVLLANPYPRTVITRKLTRSRAFFFGPFVSRASAERFQNAVLDQFKVRRCEENIEPDPAHPGCIYGEMDMCLRPCQAASTVEEYRGETGRLLRFFQTNGRALTQEIEAAREQASEELEFEQAAAHHRRLQKVQEALRFKDELARDLDELFGIVVQRSAQPESVELWLLYKGFLQPALTFPYGAERGKPTSLDRRLRDCLEQCEPRTGGVQERTDHLALLNRWHYSSWRKGELLLFDGMDRIPYRKLVRAVSRVASGKL